MNTGHDGFSPSRFASRKWPISWRKIRRMTPSAKVPAPDQRVAAERDEERRELGERAELRSEPEQEDERRRRPAAGRRASRGRAAGSARSRARRDGSDLGLLDAPSGAAADPLLAALVDLLLPERHLELEHVDRVLAGGEGVGAVSRATAITTDGSPISTPSDAVVDRDRPRSRSARQGRRRAPPSSPRPCPRSPRSRGSTTVRGRASGGGPCRRTSRSRPPPATRPRRRPGRARRGSSVRTNAPPETGESAATSSPSASCVIGAARTRG